jgi:hypothetical protein
MIRNFFAMLLTATLFVVFIQPASADEQLCDLEDAQALINSGPIGGIHALSGRETGRADAWGRCQFRLYEPTHTFTTREYIVGGIFIWETYSALDRPDYDRQAATQFLDQVKAQVWLGPSGKTLVPVSLTRTGYKDVKLLDEFGGHVVYTHIYFLIRPGQLAPGEYQVRYEDAIPGERKFVARGTLTVLP